MEAKGQHHAPAALNPENNHGTHGIGRRLGPRARSKDLEKRKIPCPCRNSNPGSPHP
jgi:hypothetical protein